MEFKGDVKLMGDEYAGFYSCGLSMLDSATMRRFTETTTAFADGSAAEASTETATASADGNAAEASTETATASADGSAAEAGSGLGRRVYESEDGLRMVVESVRNRQGAYELTTTFINGSEHDVTLEMLTSFLIPDIKADRIHRLLSFWSSEGRHRIDKVSDMNMEMSWNHMAYRIEKFGNVGSMPVRKYFPFLVLEDSETGRFTAVQLYSPSSWQMQIVCRHTDRLTICGGIADRDFGHWTKKIAPGESFTAPKAVAAEGNSLEEVCDMLVKSQHPDISPIDNRMGIAFNEYCATWGNPTHENMVKVCDRIAGKGFQYLVMDSGWYGTDGYWWETTGDWQINKKRFPNGLKETADYIRSKGMIPGIWFEFEVVAPKCPLYTATEHLVKKDGVPLTVGGRRFLDMEDPWVIEHLKKSVIDTLKEAGYGYIKVDYNDTMGMGCDGADGAGENLRRKVKATQDFFRLMREEIPELVIENCSSGGHRLEPSMMELASQASFSDAHEIDSLPLIAANMHRVVRPEQCQIWAVMRKDDSDARIFYSLCATFLGRMGMSGDIYDLSQHRWELIEQGMDFYNKVSDIIRDGRTVLIEAEPESYNTPEGGQMLVRTLKGRTLVVYHRFANSQPMEEFIEKYNIAAGLKKYNVEFNIRNAALRYGCAESDFSACALLL